MTLIISKMRNISEAFIIGLIKKTQVIPFEVNMQARKVLLDYLGVVAGGKRFLREKHPKLMEGSPNSAFLNGFAAHVLELDAGYRHGMIHLGASFSAVLEAEIKN
jgi:2-methylcitrate dehydratase PrpD